MRILPFGEEWKFFGYGKQFEDSVETTMIFSIIKYRWWKNDSVAYVYRCKEQRYYCRFLLDMFQISEKVVLLKNSKFETVDDERLWYDITFKERDVKQDLYLKKIDSFFKKQNSLPQAKVVK